MVEESPPQPEAAEPEGAAGKIVVRARLESWIQITNAKKEVVFSRVLRSGETYTVPDEKGLTFTTGNAGGVEILVDGKKLKSLGTVGLVKRDIPLDAKKLKDGSAFKPPAIGPAEPRLPPFHYVGRAAAGLIFCPGQRIFSPYAARKRAFTA